MLSFQLTVCWFFRQIFKGNPWYYGKIFFEKKYFNFISQQMQQKQQRQLVVYNKQYKNAIIIIYIFYFYNRHEFIHIYSISIHL